MKKSIKWTAVVSAAAVMTAMVPVLTTPVLAQTAGWALENGSWRYYDSDGYVLTDSWKKSNDHWYYLDEDGSIARERQVDEYYVDKDGKRVTDAWVSVANEDYWDDNEDSEFYWYYYGSNGKMTVAKFKTIGDKTYYFDEDGHMLTGLQNIDGSNYYFGKATDGSMKKGWVELEADEEDDENDTVWAYFGSDGKRIENQVDKRINEAYYTFVDGKMVTGWYKLPQAAAENANSSQAAENTDSSQAAAENAGSSQDAAENTDSSQDAAENAGSSQTAAVTETVTSENTAAKNDSAAGYQYYEKSGKRAAGWLNITGIPGLSNEDELYRFYFKSGVPYFAETGIQVFNIGSDRYAFNMKGEMQTGLKVVTLSDGTTANYYFDANGAMKTGKQTIFNEDLDMNQNWFFYTEGSQKGQGFHGIRSNVIYDHGLRLEADSDMRYAPVTFEGQSYLVNASGTIQKATASSKSSTRPELGAGFRDVRDSNDIVWTVDVNGIVQK